MTNPNTLATPASEYDIRGSTTIRSAYEQFRPLIVWLGLSELAWIAYWLMSSGRANPQSIGVTLFWAASMLVWMVAVIYAGRRGYFLQWTHFFSNLVGFALVLLFFFLLFGAVPGAWEGLITAAENTPDSQLISIHILRILAIGTVIKYLQGELPRRFLILGSMPDLLFGISAVVVVTLAVNDLVGHAFLVAWHSLGMFVFLGAGISMFFTVRSPLHIFDSKPDASIAFQFPMLLAPNFTVPLFVLAHGVALVKLLAG